jgi:1,2-phenylacetyl-CoA epoxidase PaaB subunit
MERYLVFARAEYDKPLEHRGDVEAPGDDEAAKLARERYGEEWLEMSLVPVSQVYWAEREEEDAGVEA